jgi:thioredoxin 2
MEERTMADTLLVSCPECHTKNKVPQDKLGQQAKCGKCGESFTASTDRLASPMAITDSTFSKEVLQSSIPVLVDFWAPWCGPCKMIAPTLEELAKDYAGQIKIAKLNTDENQQTAAQHKIQGIPTLLFVKNGQVVDQLVGAAPKPTLDNKIQQLL